MKKIIKNNKDFFVNEKNDNILSDLQNFWNDMQNDIWEKETYKVFDIFLNKEHSYIDLGAWIGPTVLYGSQLAKKCYAIEPDPIAFKELELNVKLNKHLNNIQLHNHCISNVNGKVSLGTRFGSGGDSMSSLVFSNKKSWLVDSMTLEKFIEVNSIKDCNFIKMDIEGGEIFVLPNIKNYLQKYKPTIHISLHPMLFIEKENNIKEIISILKLYENIYTNDGFKIDLSNEHFKNKSFDLIVTEKKWK